MLALDFSRGGVRRRYAAQREFCPSQGAVGPSDAADTPQGNYLKGCKWSPDGSCLLSAAEDGWFRCFDLPPEAADLSWAEDARQLPREHEAAAQLPADGEVAGARTDHQAIDDRDGAHAARGAGGGGEPTGVDEDRAAAGVGAAAALGEAQGGGAARGEELWAALRVKEGETIYDYAWFPHMSVSDPATCCFASTSRCHPIHLWDACDGSLRCTYRAYDAMDEITAATSMTFSLNGTKLYAGYDRCIRVFDVARPGRDYRTITTFRKKHASAVQKGIISCIAFNPWSPEMMAVGSYGRTVGVYDALTNEPTFLMDGHKGGITQVAFSGCGNYLYSGARCDAQILCWDIRYNSGSVYGLQRATATTNQRIQFAIEPYGRHLLTGGEDGCVRVFDLTTGTEVYCLKAAQDTINGVGLHPCLPYVATASGHRAYSLPSCDGGEGEGSGAEEVQAATAAGLTNAMSIFQLPFTRPQAVDGSASTGNEPSGVQDTTTGH